MECGSGSRHLKLSLGVTVNGPSFWQWLARWSARPWAAVARNEVIATVSSQWRIVGVGGQHAGHVIDH